MAVDVAAEAVKPVGASLEPASMGHNETMGPEKVLLKSRAATAAPESSVGQEHWQLES